jgi:hypothetical protein
LLPAPTAPSEGSAGQSRSRSRRIISQKSELTSSGVASHRRNTRRAFHRCSAALLGSITLCVPLCFSRFRGSVPNRVALEGRSTLPAPLPDWPRNTPKSILIACRRRSVLPSTSAPSCRCRPSGEAGTSVPITQGQCTCRVSRKSEKFASYPVDNGDIGNNRRNISRLPESRPRVTAPDSA